MPRRAGLVEVVGCLVLGCGAAGTGLVAEAAAAAEPSTGGSWQRWLGLTPAHTYRLTLGPGGVPTDVPTDVPDAGLVGEIGLTVRADGRWEFDGHLTGSPPQRPDALVACGLRFADGRGAVFVARGTGPVTRLDWDTSGADERLPTRFDASPLRPDLTCRAGQRDGPDPVTELIADTGMTDPVLVPVGTTSS